MTTRIIGAFLVLLALGAALLDGGLPRRAMASVVTTDSAKRRVWSPADSASALDKLRSDLNAIIAIPEAKNGRVGVVVRSLTKDHTLYTLNPDTPLTPASNTKVVTAFTALCDLGPNYEVKTILAADAKPHDGVVKGNLYVKGFGDPFLTVGDVDALIDQFAASGVRQIDGNIVGDGTFFDAKTERTQYSGDKDVVEPLPPILALTFQGNSYTVVISSTRLPGTPLNVQTVPHSAAFDIVNTAVTSSPPAPRGRRSGRRHSMLETNAAPRQLAALAPAATVESDGDLAIAGDLGTEWAGDEPVGGDSRAVYGHTPTKRSTAKPTARPATARAATRSGRTSTARTASAKNTAGRATTASRTKASGTKATAARTSGRAAAPSRSATRSATRTAAARTAAARPVATRHTAPATTKPATTTPAAPAVAARGLSINVTTADNGKLVITVGGTLPPGRTVSYRYPMRNAPMIIAGLVYDRLRAQGITIAGQPTSGAAPAKYKSLAETGRPLIDILQLVMKRSNNFLAEYVFKMVGAAAGGQQETARRTVERIQNRMTICKVPFGRCVINDGSGLSRANCLTASALVGILEAAYSDRRIFDAFYGAMSIAGVDGTLRGRMKGTFAEKNVHGKTGTLNNVSALSGYVTTRDGEVFCFSMLMNGGGSYHGVQDRVAARLAAFTYADQPATPPADAAAH